MHKTPDVVFIGLKRSASTFLRGYFTQHPNIAWTRKGTYFIHDSQFQSGNYDNEIEVADQATLCFIEVNELLATGLIVHEHGDWDEIRFKVDHSVDEDSITINSTEVAQRIKKTLPDARIILVLRNQVDWLRTHYRNFMNALPARRKRFSDFLTTPEGQMVLYAGFFNVTIQVYFELFGRENVQVIIYEDFRKEPRMNANRR